jgi:hypothetical protein
MAPRDSSCAGSTAHPSEKRLFEKMDCRVKPGNDDYCRQKSMQADADGEA